MAFELQLEKALQDQEKAKTSLVPLPTILYVDDEEGNLEVFEACFSKEFKVFTALSGAAGIELVAQNDFDIIISDQRMPVMLGTEFLAHVRATAPLATRILLTGFSDVEEIIDSVNSGGVYRYVVKPWEVDEMRMTLRNALRTCKLSRANVKLLQDLRLANENLELKVDEKTQELREKADAEIHQFRDLLFQAEKLSSIGKLTAGICHEIKNPVACIVSISELLRLEIEDMRHNLKAEKNASPQWLQTKTKLEAHVETISTLLLGHEEMAERIEDLCDALRSQSRTDFRPSAGVNVNTIVNQSMLMTGAKTKAFFVEPKLSDVGTISCHRTQIGQVVTNLLTNAADALTEKRTGLGIHEPFSGRIVVSTRPATHDGVSGVLISVGDNGEGVPESMRASIFEEFLTTKPADLGTGLGLSLCATIVRNHQGTLGVDTDPELGGARFRLWLPTLPPEVDSDSSSTIRATG